MEEAGSAILQVTSDGNNPDTVMISYSVFEGNTQGEICTRSTSTVLCNDTFTCLKKNALSHDIWSPVIFCPPDQIFQW